MNRFLRISVVATLSLFFLSPVAAFAQDRAQMEKELESLLEQVKAKEKEFLAPSPQDLARFGEFTHQTDAGLIRLLPRGKYEKKLLTNGGGAYYSFARLTHEYGYGSDLSLEQDMFSVGFAGADFGFLVHLGDIALEDVTLEHPGVHVLASFVTPSEESKARELYRRSGNGFTEETFKYRRSVPAQVNVTYVVRSISYRRSDVMVAFRVVRRDADGSMILLWKMLKRFPTPYFDPAQNR